MDSEKSPVDAVGGEIYIGLGDDVVYIYFTILGGQIYIVFSIIRALGLLHLGS